MFGKKPAISSPSPIAKPDYTHIDTVRGEWPRDDDMTEEEDLAAWSAGMQLYDAEDGTGALQRASQLMCQALRHSLHGNDMLIAGDLPETVRRVLYATATSATEIKEMRPETARQMRLALTVCKLHGWQSAKYGGDDLMSSLLGGYYLILGMCTDDGGGLEVGLKEFFQKNPIVPTAQATEPSPQVNTDPFIDSRAGERIRDTLTAADAGDPASNARADALARQMQGCLPEEALALHERAAQLGDVESMYDAGCIALDPRSTPASDLLVGSGCR